MANTGGQPRSGVSRRDALRLLAASTTTVAAGSVIISQPAFAANGSVSCGYEFRSTPTMRVDLTNEESKRDKLSISIRNTNGGCTCTNARPQMQYAYFVQIPNLGSGGTGWIGSDDASVSSPSTLWPDGGGSVNVSVGVQITCEGTQGPVVQCWYGTTTIQVGAAKSKVKETYPLTVNNSDSNPAGIPACQSSRFRSAPLLAGGSINLVAGLIATTDDEPILGRTIDPETPQPSTDTTTTTEPPSTDTTTSTEPPSTTTTSTTTTTSPSTTTTTSSSTTTTSSTTLPPGG